MKSVKPLNIGISLAAMAFRRALKKDKTELTSISDFQHLCAKETRPKVVDFYLRSQREGISTILARTLTENASKLQQEFLRRHYHDGASITKLALYLPISERQIYAMHEGLLRHLASLLFYRISTLDAYQPLIVLNLLNVLDIRIATFTLCTQIPLTTGFIETLYMARKRCRDLLLLQEKHAAEEKTSELSHVICTKLMHPFATAAEIASLASLEATSAIPVSSVHAYLREYLGKAEKICVI